MTVRVRPREPQRGRPGVWHCSTDQKLCFVFVQSLSRVPTLCDPMDCSTPGFSVLQHLLELAQTHIHWISDAIQPSHSVVPFFSRLQSFPASGFFFFQWVVSSHQVAKELELQFQHQSFQWTLWFPLGLTGLISLQSKRLSKVFSNTTIRKHQFFGTQPSL